MRDEIKLNNKIYCLGGIINTPFANHFSGTLINLKFGMNSLKEKSNYQTDVALTKNSKVLILQTCSMNQEIQSSGGKYQLIIGKLTATQDNKY